MELFYNFLKPVQCKRITNRQLRNLFFTITIIFLTLYSSKIFAQENAALFGKVVDSATNEELIGANLILGGTTIGAATDIDGNYKINNIPTGTYNLIVSMIGYSKYTVTEIKLNPGEQKKLDLSLVSEAFETEEVVVTAEALKNTETSVLKVQQNSSNIVDGVSSELIKKNNSSDGTDVLKRMTGVTISEGKYAYVRGVGDRYNNTLLNGSSVPSTDSEKRSFSYDIIPAEMIQNVITAKTFSPDKPGDFTGGLVQISTVEFPSRFTLNISATGGYNSNSTFNPFTTYQGGSTDWLGADDGTRSMPGTINETPVVRGNYTNAELQQIGLSFKNDWSTESTTAPINGSIKFTVGDNYNLGDEDLIGYIASFDYGSATSNIARERNFYDYSGPRYTYSGVTYNNAVMLSGLLNLSYKFGGTNKISFKNMYNRTSDDETTIFKGDYRYADQYRDITSLRFVERTLLTNQLIGEHFINVLNGFSWDWGASYGNSTMNEPDARRYVYWKDIEEPNNPLRFLLDQSLATRYYGELNDNDYNFLTNFSTRPLENQQLLKISFGGLYNKKDRNFDARIFGFRNNVGGNFAQKDSILQLSVDRIFQPENINPTFISVTEVTKPSDSYDANQKVAAGYLMFDAMMLTSFRFVVGARFEYSEQILNSFTTTGELVNVNDYYRDWLPSVNLTYIINPKMNLRFGFNKTLARPEFREIAPFTYFDFIENVNVKGNPELTRTLVDNYDLRYEIFPGAAELLAVSVFYKYFRNPIEQTLLASSQNEPVRSYANAENAQNLGAELEVRKGLGFIGNTFSNFSAVANISVIRSEVHFSEDGDSTSFQQSNRPLQGQANYIVNVGLYYDDFELGLNSSLTYNRVGPRIDQVGYADIGNIIEDPFDLLDFNISKRFFEKFVFKLTVNDILNQDRIFTQETENFGDQLSQSYNLGRTFKFSINYNL